MAAPSLASNWGTLTFGNTDTDEMLSLIASEPVKLANGQKSPIPDDNDSTASEASFKTAASCPPSAEIPARTETSPSTETPPTADKPPDSNAAAADVEDTALESAASCGASAETPLDSNAVAIDIKNTALKSTASCGASAETPLDSDAVATDIENTALKSAASCEPSAEISLDSDAAATDFEHKALKLTAFCEPSADTTLDSNATATNVEADSRKSEVPVDDNLTGRETSFETAASSGASAEAPLDPNAGATYGNDEAHARLLATWTLKDETVRFSDPVNQYQKGILTENIGYHHSS